MGEFDLGHDRSFKQVEEADAAGASLSKVL